MILICTIFLAGIIAAVIFCKPYLGIAFVILSIPFEGRIDLGFISIYPLEAILAIFGLICIYKLIDRRENCFRNTKLMYCCIPFVLCIMLSAVKSIDYSLTVKEIVRWLELFMIYYLTINLINDEKKMRMILYSIFLTVAVVSMCSLATWLWLGIVNYLSTGVEITTSKSNLPPSTFLGHRAISFFGNSNPLAGYVNLIIPVLFGMLMTSASLWERSTLVIITILSFMTWCFTYSRVAWMSLALTMVLLIFQTKAKKRGTLFLAIFFAILVTAFLIPDVRDNFIDRTKLQNLQYVLKHRATCYTVGYDLLKDDFILGIGVGNYPFIFKKFVYSDPSLIWRFVHYDNSLMLTHLHSLYLQIFVETGFLGLSAFIFWLVCIVKYLVSSLKSLENSRHYWLFVGLVGGVIVYLFNNLTDVLVVHGIHLQWGIILGLAVVLIQFRESEKWPETV